jgi:hypothetical protein
VDNEPNLLHPPYTVQLDAGGEIALQDMGDGTIRLTIHIDGGAYLSMPLDEIDVEGLRDAAGMILYDREYPGPAA